MVMLMSCALITKSHALPCWFKSHLPTLFLLNNVYLDMFQMRYTGSRVGGADTFGGTQQ